MRGAKPAGVTGAEPARAEGAEPAGVTGDEPTRVRGAEPSRVMGGEPMRVNGDMAVGVTGAEHASVNVYYAYGSISTLTNVIRFVNKVVYLVGARLTAITNEITFSGSFKIFRSSLLCINKIM